MANLMHNKSLQLFPMTRKEFINTLKIANNRKATEIDNTFSIWMKHLISVHGYMTVVSNEVVSRPEPISDRLLDKDKQILIP